jgi:hypothetical protein
MHVYMQGMQFNTSFYYVTMIYGYVTTDSYDYVQIVKEDLLSIG